MENDREKTEYCLSTEAIQDQHTHTRTRAHTEREKEKNERTSVCDIYIMIGFSVGSL